MPSLPYRENVATILVRDDLILLGERIDLADVWQLPQGGLESGESHIDAIFRELREELGILNPVDLCTIVERGPTLRYDWPDTFASPLAADFCGQEQTLYLIEYVGDDADIAPLRFDDPKPEFREVCWLSPADAVERCWSLKRPNLLAALEFFGRL